MAVSSFYLGGKLTSYLGGKLTILVVNIFPEEPGYMTEFNEAGLDIQWPLY